MRFEGKVQQGKFVFSAPIKWKRYLDGMEEKTLVFDIDELKNKRSLSQNFYYWTYLGIIENETGNSADDLHEIAKRKFLPPRFVKSLDGKEIRLPGSTTGLSKTEFSEYLHKICAWSGVPLPNPEDAGYISNY